jgi:DNA-binding MarR family transcriptional regulator
VEQSLLPVLPCFCANLRRGSRALTQLYDDALRPFGLRSTQFTILQVLSRAGELNQGQLAEMLAMDSTTLTRTLGILRAHGWILERRGKPDRRERWVRLSPAGKTQFGRALPAWRRVQSRLRRTLGERTSADLLQLLHRIAHVFQTQGESS